MDYVVSRKSRFLCDKNSCLPDKRYSILEAKLQTAFELKLQFAPATVVPNRGLNREGQQNR